MIRYRSGALALVCLAMTTPVHALELEWDAAGLTQMLQQALDEDRPPGWVLAQQLTEQFGQLPLPIGTDPFVSALGMAAMRVGPGGMPPGAEKIRDFWQWLDDHVPRIGDCRLEPPGHFSLLNTQHGPGMAVLDFSGGLPLPEGVEPIYSNGFQELKLRYRLDGLLSGAGATGLVWGAGYIDWEWVCDFEDPITGKCMHWILVPVLACADWSDPFDTELSGSAEMHLELGVEHDFDEDLHAVIVRKTVGLTGSLYAFPEAMLHGAGFDPVSKAVSSAVADALNHSSARRYLGKVFEQMLGDLSNAGPFKAWLDDEELRLEAEFPPVLIRLPTEADEQLIQLLTATLTLMQLNAPMAMPFYAVMLEPVIRAFLPLAIYVAVTGNEQLLEQLVQMAMCPTSRFMLAPMLPANVFVRSGGKCVPINPDLTQPGPYYAERHCRTPLDFEVEAYQDFCDEIFAELPNRWLGNANWTPTGDPIGDTPTRAWSIPHGARFQLGAEPIVANHVPVMKRVRYKSVNGCDLEMRVYKEDAHAENLQPLIALHGGGWQLRTGTFPPMEAQISHFTGLGFVVFAPFYRLAGGSDGDPACQGAQIEDIVEDVEHALLWVLQHGETLGARPAAQVAVWGQSAGANLAAWLMTYWPDAVSRGMLLYPPADLQDFVANYGPGLPYQDFDAAAAFLRSVLGLPDGADLNTVPPQRLAAFSYPSLVDPATTPPAFLLHGVADAIVPVDQSSLMCAAYDDAGQMWPTSDALYRSTYTCGSGLNASRLHLFPDADHALDAVCIPLVTCLAGNFSTSLFVQDSLAEGRAWLHLARQVNPRAWQGLLRASPRVWEALGNNARKRQDGYHRSSAPAQPGPLSETMEASRPGPSGSPVPSADRLQRVSERGLGERANPRRHRK